MYPLSKFSHPKGAGSLYRRAYEKTHFAQCEAYARYLGDAAAIQSDAAQLLHLQQKVKRVTVLRGKDMSVYAQSFVSTSTAEVPEKSMLEATEDMPVPIDIAMPKPQNGWYRLEAQGNSFLISNIDIVQPMDCSTSIRCSRCSMQREVDITLYKCERWHCTSCGS